MGCSPELYESRSLDCTWPLPGMAEVGTPCFLWCLARVEELIEHLNMFYLARLLFSLSFHYREQCFVVWGCLLLLLFGFLVHFIGVLELSASSAFSLGYARKKEAQGTHRHVRLWTSRSLPGLPFHHASLCLFIYNIQGFPWYLSAGGLRRSISTHLPGNRFLCFCVHPFFSVDRFFHGDSIKPTEVLLFMC